MGTANGEALARAAGIVGSARDIVCGRIEGADPPNWCRGRGWGDYLLGLDHAALERCEREGSAEVLSELTGAPASLMALARAAREASRIPTFASCDGQIRSLDLASLRSASPRKRAQLSAMLAAIGTLAKDACRVVDFGSGRGHLTRVVASALGRDALGIERNPERVARAEAMTEPDSLARFSAVDARRTAIDLNRGDLAIGLHACGALGDLVVVSAARAGAAVALVGCCPQKIDVPSRAPLTPSAGALELPRAALGLANLSSGDVGVERSRAASLEGREARSALAALLRLRGIAARPGDEMRGVNRRRAMGPFEDLAARAFSARGLAPPTRAELEASCEEGQRVFSAMRRLSLPRAALARLIEVAIALDRAAYLESRGYTASVVELVPRAITPRNVAVLATPSN